MVTIKEEYPEIIDAYGRAGGDKEAIASKEVASLVVNESRVLRANQVAGLLLKSEEKEQGVAVELTVDEGKKIKTPVLLCFGILPKEGRQEITLKVNVQDYAEVSVIAHCVFPNAVNIIHQMDADIKIGNNAKFSYLETHYHGDFGGIQVIPRAKVEVGEKGEYQNTFSLVEGRVGKLDVDYEITCAARSVVEIIAKVYGKEDDVIKIVDRINLNGEGARSLIKSRVVPTGRSWSEVTGETYGNAPHARGHMDCMEVVIGEQAIARAIPLVVATNDKAKVTHEAAIGSIDRKQMQTLMARGLDEDKAIDVIVKGILR
jgi:Fe-S cluster assembly scaffold protein SufB